MIWHTLEQWLRHLLDQITLADLLQSQEQVAERLRLQLQAEPFESLGALLTLTPAIRG